MENENEPCGCGGNTSPFQGCGSPNCAAAVPEGITGLCGIHAVKSGNHWTLTGTLPPKMEAGNNVSVAFEDKIDDDGCPYKVYTINAIDKDEKLKVCANSPAKYGKDIFKANSPLNVEYNCNDGLITFSIDAGKLAKTKYKDCQGTVLEDGAVVMTPENVNDMFGLGNCFGWFEGPEVDSDEIEDPQPCQKKYLKRKCEDQCSCCTKGISQITLAENILIEQEVQNSLGEGSGTGSGFYVIGGFGGSVQYAGQTFDGVEAVWKENFSYGPLAGSDWGAICNGCTLGRLVEVKASGSIEASWGVNGLRVQLYKVCKDGVFTPVAEWRDSPISDPDVDSNGLPDNYQVSSAGAQPGRLNWGYKYQERQTFNMSRKIRLENEECCIIMVVKVSSVIDDPDYDLSIPAQVAILGEMSSDGSVSGDMGAVIGMCTIDDCCIIKSQEDECNCGLVPPADPDTGEPTLPTPIVLPPACAEGATWSETGGPNGGGWCMPSTLPGTGAG